MTKTVESGNFMGGVCDETCAGWRAFIWDPFYSVLYSYIMSSYIAYIVSPYITTKHNVYYALAYSVTAYSYIMSCYISAALYTGGGVRQGDCLAFSSFRFIALRRPT
jgi:hypothetical protein